MKTKNTSLTPAHATSKAPKSERAAVFMKNKINPAMKNEGLKNHKIFGYTGPVNKYTRDCDAHYKVTYLLLQRDLKGIDVLKDGNDRVEKNHDKLREEKENELANFKI